MQHLRVRHEIHPYLLSQPGEHLVAGCAAVGISRSPISITEAEPKDATRRLSGSVTLLVGKKLSCDLAGLAKA